MNLEPATHRLIEKVSELEMLPMDRYGEVMPGLKWNPLRFDEATPGGFFIVQKGALSRLGGRRELPGVGL